jgi:hypothetical protein
MEFDASEKVNVLEEAHNLTSGPRQVDYGHPIEDHTRTAKMWSAILGAEVTAEKVCLCMVALKISRYINKPKRDSLVDGCGYLRNVEMIEEARKNMDSNERDTEVP